MTSTRRVLRMEACPVVRFAGLMGMSGALCLVAGDMLITRTLTGADPSVDHLVALRASVESTYLYTSGVLGGLGAIFYSFGAWHVYHAVRPAGARVAAASTASLAAMLVATGVYHALFVALNFGARVATVADAGPTAAALALALPEQYAGVALRTLVIPPAVVFTLITGVAIVAGRTRYPRWFALVSPFVLLTVYAVLTTVAGPSSVLSYALLGNVYNLSILIFFTLSTIWLWSRDRPGEAAPSCRAD